MNKNQQKNRMGAVIILLAAACLNGYAQQDSTKVSSDSKEEGNRNVMLNAASANGPREISIGLPGGDVNVLENGLPVVYNSNPHNVNTHWRRIDFQSSLISIPIISLRGTMMSSTVIFSRSSTDSSIS